MFFHLNLEIDRLFVKRATEFAGSFNNLASTSASVSDVNTQGNREVGTYTIDVSSPNGLEAYQELLHLSTGAADALSEIRGSGVRATRFTEASKTDEFRASLGASGSCLLLHRALVEERQGEVTTSDQGGLLYRENKYSKETKNPVTGSP